VPKYDVHLWALVRVKVAGVEAGSHADAIQAAQDRFFADAGGYFRDYNPRGLDAAEVELADGEPPAYYLVDEHGDTEHANSRHYCSDGVTPLGEGGGCCGLCVRPLSEAQEEKGDAVNA
jgi:hypothetical protein